MADKNQKIKCEVEHCEFNEEKKLCNLEEIKVCKCECGYAGGKENTLCGSYKYKKD